MDFRFPFCIFLLFICQTEAGVHLETAPSNGYFDVIQSRSFRLGCVADEPLGSQQSLQWYTSANEPIDSRSPSRFTVGHSTLSAKSTLVFTKIQPHDEGTYVCKLVDQDVPVGEVSAHIRVNKDIIWRQNKTVYGGRIGDPLTIDCGVEAEGATVIVEATDDQDRPLEVSALTFQRANDEYTIPVLTDEYQNVSVTCLAFILLPNKVTVTERHQIRIEVYRSPTFVRSTRTQYAIPGRTATIRCEVDMSVPPVTQFEFLRDSDLLQTNGRWEINSYPDRQYAEFRIANTSETDFYTYTCRAHNGVLSGTIKIQLQEAERPKQPKVTYLGVDGDSALWEVLNDEENQLPVISYAFRYAIERIEHHSHNLKPGNDMAAEWLKRHHHSASKRLFSRRADNLYRIPDLHTDKRYMFEFTAWNAAGEGEPLYLKVNLERRPRALSDSMQSSTCSFFPSLILLLFTFLFVF